MIAKLLRAIGQIIRINADAVPAHKSRTEIQKIPLRSRMELEEGKRNLSRYRTPAGILEFGVETEQISFREEDGLLEVEALYTLHSGEEPIQKSRVVVTVKNI